MSRLIGRISLCLAIFTLLTTIAVTSAAAESHGGGQEYVVQRGDSLYKISESTLGDGALWPLILEATNAKAASDDSFAAIENPRVIFAGQRLWIADDSMPHDDMADGEKAEGDMADSETAEGDMADGETAEGDMADSETAEGDMADSETAEGDMADSETAEGDMADDAVQKALVNAADQLSIALAHANLLKSALEADSLEEAQSHAEHVINLLDGEEGRTFGDGNRDGVTQNPGDGVGVRAHLEEANLEGEMLVQDAIDAAGQMFAADTTEEGLSIADNLDAALSQVQSAVSGALAGMDPDGHDMDDMDAVGDAMAHEDDALVAAQKQVELALVHHGFSLNELGAGELAKAINHIEHVANILDGKDGNFYGDNNRDGQTQNPGDGVGVRGHLANAVESAESAEGDALTTAVEQAQQKTEDASDQALQVFGAGSVDDAQPIADELGELLAELQDMVEELKNSAGS